MRFALYSLAVTLSALHLAAQTASFHTEMSDELHSGRPQLVVVNDSSKRLVAFDTVDRCPGSEVEPSHHVVDLLNVPAGETSGQTEASGRPVREPGIGLKGRWNSFVAAPIATSTCALQVDTVVFADGSYEGDQVGLQSIYARRSGLSSALKEWIEFLDHASPDAAGVEAIKAEADARIALNTNTSLPKLGTVDVSTRLLDDFWHARLRIDSNIQAWVSSPPNATPDAAATYSFIRNQIDKWQRKVDRDPSMAALSESFSWLSQWLSYTPSGDAVQASR